MVLKEKENNGIFTAFPERDASSDQPAGTHLVKRLDVEESSMCTIWLFNIAMENHHF
jgi:hypothetical protein